MDTNTIVLIAVVVLAAIVLISVIALISRKKRNELRHAEAVHIRETARDETLVVQQREARAEEIAARARAAQAEADIKAAQARALELQAKSHRSEATASREQVEEQLTRADSLDPAPPAGDVETARHREPQHH